MRTVYESVTQGLPVEQVFIDVHGHFGPWPETTIPHAMDHPRLIADMDRHGCDAVWMAASDPGYSDDVSVKNGYVFDFAEQYPDRILPYCTLSAHRPEQCVDELKRCISRGRCVGVKMHRYEQPPYTVRADFLQPVLELLQDHKLVYMNHDYPDLPALRWALERYPDLVFISGHCSPRINDLAREHPNLRDCTCAAHGYRELEAELRRIGRSDTMLLGSDFGLLELCFGIGMLAYAELPEQDKQNVLGLNALRLLRRTRWFGELRFSKPVPPEQHPRGSSGS